MQRAERQAHNDTRRRRNTETQEVLALRVARREGVGEGHLWPRAHAWPSGFAAEEACGAAKTTPRSVGSNRGKKVPAADTEVLPGKPVKQRPRQCTPVHGKSRLIARSGVAPGGRCCLARSCQPVRAPLHCVTGPRQLYLPRATRGRPVQAPRRSSGLSQGRPLTCSLVVRTSACHWHMPWARRAWALVGRGVVEDLNPLTATHTATRVKGREAKSEKA